MVIAALGAAGCKRNLVEDTGTLPPPPDLPVLTVTQPERASFVDGPVTVAGTAEAGTGALVSLEVNGEPVAWNEDGSFAHELVPDRPGALLIGTRVEDDLDERAVDGRAVQWGPTHAPGATIDNALAMQIGPAMLDDDAPDLDDMASIVEVVLEDDAFKQSLVGMTFEGTFDVTVTGYDYDSADVDIAPQEGILWFDTYMNGVFVDFETSFLGIPAYGWVAADRAVLQMDLEVSSGPDGLVVKAVWTHAELQGFSWTVDWVPSWLEDAFADSVRDDIETDLETQAEDLVGSLIGDALSSFAIDTTFGDADELRLVLDISDASVVPKGLLLWMDASVEALVPGLVLPPNAGSVRSDGAPPALPITTDRSLVTVVDDDFLNQMLFGFWHAGALGGMQFSGTELALMSGQELPAPLGPVDFARMDLDLPPVITPPTGEMDFDLALGELRMGITREDGVLIETSLSVRGGADLSIGSHGMSFVIDNRPAMMEVHAGMLAWPEVLDPGDLASLFRLSTPNLLGRSSDLFPAFPPIELPVGDMLDMDAVDGLVWELDDVEVRMTPEGWFVLEGRMVEQ